MQIPAVMFIESAADALSGIPDWARQDQQKELSSMGDVRIQRIGASGLSDDFRKGYELGLQTARVLIAANPSIAIKGVNPNDVL